MGIGTTGARRTNASLVVLGVVSAAIVMGFAVLAANVITQADRSERETDIDRNAVILAAELDGQIDDMLAEANAAATRGSTGNGSDLHSFSGSGLVEMDSRGRRSGPTDLGPIADPLGHEELQAALDLARDTARPVLSAPIGDGTEPVPVVAVAIYRVDTESEEESLSIVPDVTGAARRKTIDSWFVGAVDTERIREAALSPGDTGHFHDIDDFGMTLTDGEATLVRVGPTPEFGVVTSRIEVGAREWTLEVGTSPGPPRPALFWLVLGGGALAALLIIFFTSATTRRWRSTEEERLRTERNLGIITEIAPVVQESLDPAVVLPSVCLRLVDELDLTGVSCATVGESGAVVEVFAHGAPVDSAVTPRLEVPSELEAEQTFALSLERNSRAVGVLRVRTGRALGQAELAPLALVADLSAAAIVNSRLFDEQRRTVERLKELDALKTSFIGTASHELRTPVTAILGFARLLDRTWDRMEDDQRRQMVSRVAANSAALDQLLSELLDFARIERGEMRVAREPVNLSGQVASLLERIEPVHVEHRIVADVEDDVWVIGDVSNLDRIVSNLVSNAVKFSPVGTQVTVSVRLDHSSALLVVDDEGEGVPEADRERVFSRFYRGAGDQVLRTRGAGIGLSVVAELIAQMDGEVAIATSPAGGARFTVSFPVASTTDSEPAWSGSQPDQEQNT